MSDLIEPNGRIRSTIPRREEDRIFTECPKYLHHDITEDQVMDIALRVLELNEARRDKEIANISRKGFYYICGALALGLYSWAVSHGFIEVHK